MFRLQFLLLFSHHTGLVFAEECSAEFYARTDHCTHEVNKNQSIGWETATMCQNTIEYETGENCLKNTPCGKNFRVSVFDQQLFAITMKNTFIDMLTRCCKRCARCSVVNEIEDTMHLNESILNSSDIIFPVLSDASVDKIHGFFFLDVFKVPGFYYFTRQKTGYAIVKEIVSACAGLWPFLLICLLFAAISGCFVWIIETRMNREDFPRRFYAGIFDGFWWSFVSMTTVGFGDKVTKSYLGKIYAVFWILAGITICSMFTASLTTEIMNARKQASTDMADKDVAVLNDRLHDISVVADHGGIVRNGNITHTMHGINQMVDLLKNHMVDGFLLDRNTYYHFSDRSKEAQYKSITRKMRSMGMVKEEKRHSGQELSCGIMVKSKEDYIYFKGYFDNNRLDIRTCNAVSMNTKGVNLKRISTLFSGKTELFEKLLIVCVGVLALVVIAGIAFEGRRYYIKVKTVEESEKSLKYNR